MLQTIQILHYSRVNIVAQNQDTLQNQAPRGIYLTKLKLSQKIHWRLSSKGVLFVAFLSPVKHLVFWLRP
ncbi:hypothetical protein Rhal01_02929 [Rubritalea halochordaticola]|uniref:YlxR domain-containing protein n=1 Tax=Rubritalea halochordaticola TaxID=714537 RepID=A0ABP9V597_9BACT